MSVADTKYISLCDKPNLLSFNSEKQYICLLSDAVWYVEMLIFIYLDLALKTIFETSKIRL